MDTARRPFSTTSACGYDLYSLPTSISDHEPITGTLLVVDEHPLSAAGLQQTLSRRGWLVETSSGPTAADVIDHAQRLRPKCVLLDIRLGDDIGCGVDLIAPLAATGAHVVMLTAERRRTVLAECLEVGADGWIDKSATLDEVDDTLKRLLSGGAVIGQTIRAALLDNLLQERTSELRAQSTFEQLSQRELLVLAALADGLSADEIAHDHFVALTTVRSQIRAVLQKLGVRSQLAAVALADAHRELLPEREQAGRDRRRAFLRDHDAVVSLSASIA